MVREHLNEEPVVTGGRRIAGRSGAIIEAVSAAPTAGVPPANLVD
jgi:hypothetical protein